MNTRTLISKVGFLVAAVAIWGCGPSVDLATRVVLSQVPAQIEAGQPLGLVATVQTNQGQVVEAYEGDITVSISAGPDMTALGGAATVKAVKGVATFTDLTLTKVGQGYVLRVKPATVPGGRNIPDATSSAISVVAGDPAGLHVVTQPGKAAPGGIIFPYPRVAVADAHGNVITTESAQVTVSLGNNPGGSALTGTLQLTTVNGVVEFTDLSLNNLGTGYTLTFSGGSAGTATSAPFDVVQPRLVYTDPTIGRVRLVKNAAGSSDSSVLLELKVFDPFTGYSAGFNIPSDGRVVSVGPSALTYVGGLNPGSSPAAMGALMGAPGTRLADVITAGVSQKATGSGAITTNTEVPVGTVLFTLRVDMKPVPIFKAAFDGAAMAPGFEAAVRNRAGDDVVSGLDFGIGRLAVE